MTLALDTDAIVHWLMDGATHHQRLVHFVQLQLHAGARFAIVPQVLHEFVHVTTDSRRFEKPLTMSVATALARSLWEASEVDRVLPGNNTVPRTLELLDQFSLGRKRILDTALAATLEQAGIKRLVTLNVRDYEIFPFLELQSPLAEAS